LSYNNDVARRNDNFYEMDSWYVSGMCQTVWQCRPTHLTSSSTREGWLYRWSSPVASRQMKLDDAGNAADATRCAQMALPYAHGRKFANLAVVMACLRRFGTGYMLSRILYYGGYCVTKQILLPIALIGIKANERAYCWKEMTHPWLRGATVVLSQESAVQCIIRKVVRCLRTQKLLLSAGLDRMFKQITQHMRQTVFW